MEEKGGSSPPCRPPGAAAALRGSPIPRRLLPSTVGGGGRRSPGVPAMPGGAGGEETGGLMEWKGVEGGHTAWIPSSVPQCETRLRASRGSLCRFASPRPGVLLQGGEGGSFSCVRLNVNIWDGCIYVNRSPAIRSTCKPPTPPSVCPYVELCLLRCVTASCVQLVSVPCRVCGDLS